MHNGLLQFLRFGELIVPSRDPFNPTIHLTTADISVDNRESPSMLGIHLKQSKTDLFRVGIKVYVGITNSVLCPVSAVLAYLAV